MKLKAKITILLLLLAIVAVAVPIGIIYELYTMEQKLAEENKRNLDNFIAINSIKTSFTQFDNHFTRYLLTRNPNWLKEAKKARAPIETYYESLPEKDDSDKEFSKTLAEIRQKQESYFKTVDRLVKQGNRNWNTITRLYNSEVVDVYNGINTLITSKANIMIQNNRDLVKKQEELIYLAALVELCVIPIIIGFAYVVYITTVRPINQITEKVKGVHADNPESIALMVDQLVAFVKKRKSLDEITFLARTLSQLGKQIEEKTIELNQLVITDEKTGLFNFRHFKEQFHTEFARARRFSEPLSLIMIDIDKFKHYNDTNGHLLGDEVLIKVSSLLKQECRETDIPARFGGEEFAALLPRTDSQEAFQVAERIRHTIEESVFPNQDKQPEGNLTASLGVATFPHDASDVEALINAADDALYQAKDKGRNQVVSFVNLQS